MSACRPMVGTLQRAKPHTTGGCFREHVNALGGVCMKTWLTVAEGAEYSGVSRDTIYTACERRELKHARVGGRRAIRLKPEWIDAWLEQHMRGGLHSARNDASAPVRTPEASAYP